ncbi:DUF2567 domain-containing protein [Mycolicibacterium sp. 050158]|uniref:DUF2567 domain-containing protein n=1 Tax=Mycolicibacterium sp. 050158 TaxID=3090602 RepID=UPI00299D0D84|nr:DUF2567 domain-containing protein [Mycolicibacterium sp. 050158]MDX1891052.1 DUF2567 domain-containing protein [Mycolicibacterium sp. 050158]
MTLPDVSVAPAQPVAPPRFTHRQAAVRVVGTLVVLGVVVGAVWAWLAPPIQIVIALTKSGDRVRGYLGDESDFVFLGAFLMTGLLVVLAVTTAVAAWQWRPHRGPVMVAAVSIGTLAAAGVAAGVGAALARWRWGAIDVASAPVSPEHRVFYTHEAPAVFYGHTPWQIAASVIVPAGIVALIYAICALSTKRDDLGAWPPISDPAPTAVVDRPVDPSSPSP